MATVRASFLADKPKRDGAVALIDRYDLRDPATNKCYVTKLGAHSWLTAKTVPETTNNRNVTPAA